jgi:hypothetical protein
VACEKIGAGESTVGIKATCHPDGVEVSQSIASYKHCTPSGVKQDLNEFRNRSTPNRFAFIDTTTLTTGAGSRFFTGSALSREQ